MKAYIKEMKEIWESDDMRKLRFYEILEEVFTNISIIIIICYMLLPVFLMSLDTIENPNILWSYLFIIPSLHPILWYTSHYVVKIVKKQLEIKDKIKNNK